MGRAPFAALSLAILAACDSRPDASELARWRKEAQEADTRVAAKAKSDDPVARWMLHIGGQVGQPSDVPLAELEKEEPVEIKVGKTDVWEEHAFRGVRISSLVAKAAPAASAATVTFIATDGYFATFELEHLQKHAFILAYEQDGKAMLPAFGGPLSVRFDSREIGPDLQRKYQSADVFYVTHAIVGDERASLRVGERVFDDAALAALPETTVSGPVSYRSGWEAMPQALHGVRLRDVLKAAGLTELPRAQIFGKAQIHQQKSTSPIFAGDTFDSCEPLIIRRFGADRANVPTRRGGPLLLYVNAICREKLGANAWMAFVERVEVR